MTVYEIIFEYLSKNGFDGLCTDECGCLLDDLAPCCSESLIDCVPGIKKTAIEARERGMEVDDDCEWIMVPAVKKEATDD